MVRKEGYDAIATQQQVTTHPVVVQEPAVFVMRGASGFLFVGDYWDPAKATFCGGSNPGRAPAYLRSAECLRVVNEANDIMRRINKPKYACIAA